MGTTGLTPGSAAAVGDALFTRTKQRVLGLLFGQPDRRFAVTELIDRIGGGSGAIQRELQRLAGAGLVQSERKAGRRLYRANPQSPLYAEVAALVHGLVRLASGVALPAPVGVSEPTASYEVQRPVPPPTSTWSRLGATRSQVRAFCKRHGIQTMSLFGSVMRDDYSRDSDVDVLVEFEEGRAPAMFALVGMQEELSGLFGGRPVDLVTPAVLSNPVRRRSIERDLEVIYS